MPFNIELLEWMKKDMEKGERKKRRNYSRHRYWVSFFLLRVSGIANITRGDVSIENTPRGKKDCPCYTEIEKTDQSGTGVTRALLPTGGTVSHVKVLGEFLEKKKVQEKRVLPVEMLRLRIEGSLKVATVANGVSSNIIGSHSLRAGGAAALYVRGAPITLIQRFGRWESSSFLRYLRFGSIALEPLAGSISSPLGLLEQLRMASNNKNADKCNIHRAGGKEHSNSESGKDSEAGIVLGGETDLGVLLSNEEERKDWLRRSPSVASVDRGENDLNAPPMEMRGRSPSAWSGSEDGRSQATGTTGKGSARRTQREFRERSPSNWSGSESALNQASPMTKQEQHGSEDTNKRVDWPWKGEKKEEKKEGIWGAKAEKKAKVKTEEDDLSVSEVSAEQEHLLAKQEIWGEESGGRIGRNRESLDEFSRRHQLRVKEEWNRPSGSNQNPGRKGVEFNPMEVEISRDRQDGGQGVMTRRTGKVAQKSMRKKRKPGEEFLRRANVKRSQSRRRSE